jgi:DMSO/TMAO reductase YedYZ heme-binding membrane subunit
VLGVLLARRFGRQSSKTKMRLHRQLSELSIGALAIHLAAALLDRRHVPPYALVAPFLSPVRTIAAGTGSLAVWGLLIVAFTGAARKRFKRSWRTIHYLAYPALGLVLFHSVLGSDGRQVAIWGAVAAAVLIVRALIVHRQNVRAISRSVTFPDALGEPVGVVSAGWDLPAADRAEGHHGSGLAGAVALVAAPAAADGLGPEDRLSRLGAIAPAPSGPPTRRNGWSRIRTGLGGLDGTDGRWVAAAVAVEVISYGWLAVRLGRRAISKSKKG